MGSDLINVRFARTPISDAALIAFMARNDLTLFSRPDASLPNADSWTWVFQLQDNDKFLPLPACARIMTNENGYLTICEPDLRIMRPHTDGKKTAGTPPAHDCGNLPTEFGDWGNTFFPNALWQIKNVGGTVVPSIGSGVAGADAKICDCWGAGYDGSGIVVAVVDDGDQWDFRHPNLDGQILSGFDFNMNQALTATHNGGGSTHGMQVASMIVGIPDGGETALQAHNTTNVGVAYGAKVRPYIVTLGTSNVVSAIQKAVVDGCWVINMSWGGVDPNFPQGSIAAEIESAVQLGRSGLGIVCVASVGNDNGDEITFPASMVDVIGVGATDAQDYRGSINAYDGPWDWTNIGGGGSNYHDLDATHPTVHYDVVAPGTDVVNNFTDFSLSPPQQSQITISGTSLAAPVVAGIAAIMLQQSWGYTFNDVINSIVQNADKVNGSTANCPGGPGTACPYDYHQYYSFLDGYDKEMFFGRVNCGAAITSPVVGIKEQSKVLSDIRMGYYNESTATLIFNSANKDGYILNIYDISGRQVSSQKIQAGTKQTLISTDNLINGVYLFKVTNSTTNSINTFKYIK